MVMFVVLLLVLFLTCVAVAESDDDTMPLLYVRRHKKRTVLKRLIDLMMSWEKRGAVDYRKKRSKTVIADGGEEELDCFGIQEDKQKFDYRHFCFTMLRAALMLLFSLFYLFSRRFSVKGKIVMLMLGLVNASVVAIPVLAYSYPPASDLIGEPALLWAPLIFYVLLLLTHSTIEGNWRDTGGTAASLNYMDNYAGSVYTWQSSSEKSRTKRKMRGGELITCLIENEQSGLHDPWEYTFLTFVAAPILGTSISCFCGEVRHLHFSMKRALLISLCCIDVNEIASFFAILSEISV